MRRPPCREGPPPPLIGVKAASLQCAAPPVNCRLAVGFLLDIIEIVRDGGDVLDTLLFVAITQANVVEIRGQADRQIAFAEPADVPPDAMRRPITTHALATSLRLPFETVRRRIRRLTAAGVCRAVDGGVIVPSEILARPDQDVIARRLYERARAFYYQLCDLGLLGELPRPTVELDRATLPVRTLSRLAGEYALREVDALMEALGDLVDSLIALTVFCANVETLPDDQRGGDTLELKDMVDDGLRRPIPVTGVASRLGLPPETARRHVAALLARGTCKRVRGGLIVPAEVFVRPHVQAALVGNATNLQRLFAGLAQLGVLQLWDRTRAEA